MSQENDAQYIIDSVLLNPTCTLEPHRTVTDRQWIEQQIALLARWGPEHYFARLLKEVQGTIECLRQPPKSSGPFQVGMN
jgi:hypothetical protein